MADLSSLAPRVKRYVRNAPNLMVLQALSVAARELYGESESWTETISGSLTLGEYRVTPALDAGVEWFKVNWAKIAGREIDPGQFDDPAPDISIIGAPRVYGSVALDKVHFHPTADGTYAYEVSLFCRPLLDATTVPDGLLRLHSEALTHGAAAELFSQEGYPWYNEAKVPYHRAEFSAGVQDAGARARHGYVRGNSQVNMRPMA